VHFGFDKVCDIVKEKKCFFLSFLLSSYPTSVMSLYSNESTHQNAFDGKKKLYQIQSFTFQAPFTIDLGSHMRETNLFVTNSVSFSVGLKQTAVLRE